jgi:CspA family cold shock protein
MAVGMVKWFNAERGYVFITPVRAARICSCTKSAIEGDGSNSLTEGQKVEYEETAGQKGPQAANVRVIGWSHVGREIQYRLQGV